MRLLIKITSIVLLGILILLVFDAFVSVHREVVLFDDDMANDGLLLGRTMKELISTTWQTSGADRALQLIRDVNQEEQQIEIRWVWLDAPPGDPYAPKIPKDERQRLAEEQELSHKHAVPGDGGYRLTYVVVPVGGDRVGALELAEPLAGLRDFTRTAAIRATVLTAGMILLSSILIWVLGVHYVGQPLALLVDKTKRVGTGDFGGDLELPGREVLSNLAKALNEMCRELENARDAVRRETEARIEMLEQLRHTERLATLGRLSSGIAHELGTPLNVVAGRAKIIATEELDREETVSFSRTIVEQANRMTEIIRHLLDFARRRSSQRAPVNAAELARQVIDMLAATARKSNVTLSLEGNLDVPLANIDRAQIQQVIVNLMMNGIQAMPRGGTLKITLNVERTHHPGTEGTEDKSYLAIVVEDTGGGIPKEHLDMIFDPFFTTKEVGSGTGLGLSISYGIVEEHGGWIDVQSEVGTGSRFTIYLPLEEK
ncbi:MAG: ATP-binding protein [bacterium]